MCIKSKRITPLIGMSREQKSGTWDQIDVLEEAIAVEEAIAAAADRRRRQQQSSGAAAAEEVEQYLTARQHQQTQQSASLSQHEEHQALRMSQEALVRYQDSLASLRQFPNSLNTPFRHDLVQSQIDEQLLLNNHNMHRHVASHNSTINRQHFRNPLQHGMDLANNQLLGLNNHSYINTYNGTTGNGTGNGNGRAYLDAVQILSQPQSQSQRAVPPQHLLSQPRPSLYYQAIGSLMTNPAIPASAGSRIAAPTSDTNLLTQSNMPAQRIDRQDLSPLFNSHLLPAPQNNQPPMGPPDTQLGSLGPPDNLGTYSDLTSVLGQRQQPLNMPPMMPNHPTISSHPTVTSNDLVASSASSAQRGHLLSSMRRKSAKSFEEHFQSLLEFKELHGHCNVPHRYKENTSLGNWCNNIRTSYRKMKDGGSATSYRLTTAQISQLEKIGFKWRVYYRNANMQRLEK